MHSQIYWITLPMSGRLAIMARPRADDWLDDEVSGWRAEGIDTVVSLLEREEISDLGLQREAGLCQAQGIEFVSFPIPDRGVPESLHDVMALVREIATRLDESCAVAVHCRAGIGRSSLIAACALVYSGLTPKTAFEMIGEARGVSVPDTERQREWVRAFRDAVLNVRNVEAQKPG